MFGRKKKSAPEDPSPLSAQRPFQAGQANQIDAISERWKNGDESAQTEYWNAQFALPEWYFIGRGSLESGNIQPYINVVEGNRPMIQAFTSAERAHEGRESLDLTDTSKSVVPGGAYAILSKPPEAAIRSYASYSLSGVVGMMFDSHVFGAFALLSNLPGMWKHSGRKRIDDIVLPAAPGEFAHLAGLVQQAQGDAKLLARANVLIRLCHLDKVGFITKSVDSNEPAIISIDDKLYLPIVASPDEVQSTKQFVMSSGGVEPGVAAFLIRDFIKIVAKIQNEAGVELFLFNTGASNHAERIDTLLTVWHQNSEHEERQARAEQLIAAAAAASQ